jgi:hypothetical protein
MAVLPESLSVKIRVGARSHFIPVEADAARKHKRWSDYCGRVVKEKITWLEFIADRTQK